MTAQRLDPDAPKAIEDAAAALKSGRLVALPTETVYGLGGDATSDAAVAAIFEAKGRPSFNPLILHRASAEAAFDPVIPDDRATALAAHFWPGPLTMVLPRRSDAAVSLLASAGLESLAVRVPAHPVAQALLQSIDRPLAAPSANPSGRISPTRAEHVLDGLGQAEALAFVLDGGACAVGLESTVVDLTGDNAILLRPGGLDLAEIEAVIGPVSRAGDDAPNAPKSPGQLTSHYAPLARLRLDVEEQGDGSEALLAFGPNIPSGYAPVMNLSERGDVIEAAANLFGYLRTLDSVGSPSIAAMTVPDVGLGQAINDRLRRAAAPRFG